MPLLNPQWHAYNEHLAYDFPSLLSECQQPRVNEPLSSRYVGTFPHIFSAYVSKGCQKQASWK